MENLQNKNTFKILETCDALRARQLNHNTATDDCIHIHLRIINGHKFLFGCIF